MRIPFALQQLAEYRDKDPDAVHYRPFNVSEYNSTNKDLMHWRLNVSLANSNFPQDSAVFVCVG
jgi:hypothetical protein